MDLYYVNNLFMIFYERYLRPEHNIIEFTDTHYGNNDISIYYYFFFGGIGLDYFTVILYVFIFKF